MVKGAKKELKTVAPKGAYLNKTELLNNFMVETGLPRKLAKSALDAVNTLAGHELKKGRKFVVPGMARFVVRSKPATKARKGINPFTKEPCVFKAKPARKQIKAFPVKAFKEVL